MIENYLQMFADLRTDRGRDRYPAITCHRAPHKPFLHLSVMDLIAQGRITQNLIQPAWGLGSCFDYRDCETVDGRHPFARGFRVENQRLEAGALFIVEDARYRMRPLPVISV